MNDTTKMALAAAVAGGYVLGRTRKAKLAFGMATYLLGRRFGVSPQQLLAEGLRRLAESPQFSQLSDQIRGELKDAGLARLDSFADALHERTQLIGVLQGEPGKREDEEHEEYEEHEEEAGTRERRRSPGRRAPKARTESKPAPAKKTAAKKAAPAKKTAAKKAAKKGAAAKRTAAKKSAAKKTSARPGRGR